MNCRAFHNKLEDYLQDGLDFSSRFGIERHAQECISCGKDLADALDLRRMVPDLKQVQAPADFESVLLDKIRMYKANAPFAGIRKLWVYGPEWLSWKNLMLASSSLAVLVLGFILAFHRTALKTPAFPPVAARQTEKPEKVEERANPLTMAGQPLPKPSLSAANDRRFFPMSDPKEIPKTAALPASLPADEYEPFRNPKELVADFIKVKITGRDIRREPLPILPKKIWLQYYPASEEYFLHYVSH